MVSGSGGGGSCCGGRFGLPIVRVRSLGLQLLTFREVMRALDTVLAIVAPPGRTHAQQASWNWEMPRKGLRERQKPQLLGFCFLCFLNLQAALPASQSVATVQDGVIVRDC